MTEYRDWRYLTDCRYFESGKCINSGKCLYRHRLEQTEFEISTVCKKWAAYQCFDVSCPFLHPGDGMDSSNYQSSYQPSKESYAPYRQKNDNKRAFTFVSADPPLDELDKQTGICKFFLSGKCKAGTSCSFKHELPEAQYKRKKTSSSISDKPSNEASRVLEKYSMKHHVKTVLSEEISSNQSQPDTITETD